MGLKAKVVRSLKWTTAGTVVNAIIGLLKIAILTRYLDKSDFGLMALTTFIMGFMNLFNDMGITSAILHKQHISVKEYSSLYWLNIIVSIFLYGILVIIAPLASYFYSEPLLVSLISILGLNLLISASGRMFKTIDSKNLKFKVITIIDIISYLFSLIAAVFLAMNGYGVFSLVYSAIVQYLIQNFLYFFHGMKMSVLSFYFNYAKTKPFLKIGVYQVGGQVVNYFNKDLDILIIGKFFSQDILGGYSLAKQLVYRPAQILNPILIKVASPALAKFQDDKEILKKHFLNLISLVAKVNIIVYLITIVLAKLIVELLYGPEYQSIVILVQILSVYMIFRAIGNPIGSLVIATGKTNLEFYWNLATILITPAFIFIGSQFGIEGVAIFLTLSMGLLFYPSWRLLVYKMTGTSFKEYLYAILYPKSPMF